MDLSVNQSTETSTEHATDSWSFREGDAITPDLTVVRRLGGGAACEAYLAFDEVTYGPVVVKLVRPLQVKANVASLAREVEMLSIVNHPVVVRGLRAVLDGDRPHVVLEALDGPRLSTLVRRYGPLPEQQYLPLAIEMASALHYLRRLGIVHLDVKPSNIIMGAPARLIDLSVARPVEDAAALQHAVGTDAYMSPEQCEPAPGVAPGFASDVFGLGATLFEAITGEPAYDEGVPGSDDIHERFPQVIDLPYGLPQRVPADVAKIVLACLAHDAADRPLPHEVAEALQPALERVPQGKLAGLRIR